MNGPIPSFESPPLAEVFLGIQFDSLDEFNLATYGMLWDKFRSHFPMVENHAPLEPHIERIGGVRRALGELPRVRIEALNSAPLPRAWFLSEDGQELIQIQPDRFLRNWRRQDGNEYPRYKKHIRDAFLQNIKDLESFVEDFKLGTLKPNQCEISYINHIDLAGSHKELGNIFVGWSSGYDLSEIGELEDVNISTRHVINDGDGKFVGRLYAKLVPAFKNNEQPVYLLELTAKGRPLGEGLDGVIKFMDLGRESIVRAFAKMTTKEMHNTWKREE